MTVIQSTNKKLFFFSQISFLLPAHCSRYGSERRTRPLLTCPLQSVWICTSNPTASYLSIAVGMDLNIKPHHFLPVKPHCFLPVLCGSAHCPLQSVWICTCFLPVQPQTHFLPVHCNLCGSAHQTPLLLTCPQSVWIFCFLPVHCNLCGSATSTCPLQSVWICTSNPTFLPVHCNLCGSAHCFLPAFLPVHCNLCGSVEPHCFLPVHCNLCGSAHQTPLLLTCPLQSVWIFKPHCFLPVHCNLCGSDIEPHCFLPVQPHPTASYLSIAICVDLHIKPHCFLPVHCNLCGSAHRTPLLLTCPLQSVWICTSTTSYLSIAICVDLNTLFLPVHCNLCGSAH